jgi:hypothetical protein
MDDIALRLASALRAVKLNRADRNFHFIKALGRDKNILASLFKNRCDCLY